MHNTKQNSADFVKKYPTTVPCKLAIYRGVKNFKCLATDSVVSTWCLLTDKRMLHHIKKCRDAEGKRQLGDDT
jgi:hypothetical protein